MELFKSSRFWISISIVFSVTLLAALGKIGGDNAVSAIMGLLAGFGVGKSGGGDRRKTDVKPPITPSITILFISCVIGLTSCVNLQKTIQATSSSVKAVADLALPIYHKACLAKATDCASRDIKSAQCLEWAKCDQSRALFVKIIDGSQIGCATAMSLAAMKKDEDAKKILVDVGAKINEAYKMLQVNEVIK